MKKGKRADPTPRPEASGGARIPPKQLRDIRSRLLAHYDRGKRDLPWRAESDPYRIWVSEIMLQQTRVETVLPYYGRWVERFPTLDALANAGEEEVLKAWEGLGYYSRARRLHGAARLVRERYGGKLPDSAEELRELPGVGEYTAGAVASIAFGQAVPAVDGNVRRVLSRLFDLPDPSPSQVRTLAAELVDPERPGDFNQALMELGATVCAPRSPECGVCPLADSCLALAAGTVEQRPLRKEKKKVPEVEVTVLVAVRMGGEGAASSGSGAARGSGEPPWQHRLLLRKRPQSGLLAGMWEFPGVEGDEEDAGLADGTLAVLRLAEELGLEPEAEPTELPMELPSVAHLFSHLKAHYHPVLVPVASMAEVDEGRWVTPEGLTELPLPVAQQRIARLALKALDPRQGGFS